MNDDLAAGGLGSAAKVKRGFYYPMHGQTFHGKEFTSAEGQKF
jgi:hypothetical protein